MRFSSLLFLFGSHLIGTVFRPNLNFQTQSFFPLPPKKSWISPSLSDPNCTMEAWVARLDFPRPWRTYHSFLRSTSASCDVRIRYWWSRRWETRGHETQWWQSSSKHWETLPAKLVRWRPSGWWAHPKGEDQAVYSARKKTPDPSLSGIYKLYIQKKRKSFVSDGAIFSSPARRALVLEQFSFATLPRTREWLYVACYSRIQDHPKCLPLETQQSHCQAPIVDHRSVAAITGPPEKQARPAPECKHVVSSR